MERYGIIMAGGGGTRFWPASRQKTPKQLLNLTGKDFMINETIQRVTQVVEPEHIFIVTNEVQADKMAEVTSEWVERDHILAEPAARNTAACIGYAAFEILRKYGDGVMCIFPSDHYIKDEKSFAEILEKAVLEAEHSDNLVTIGIYPTFASTGYGYIRSEKDAEAEIRKVLEFVEKPDAATAEKYVESGAYTWNSGMFVWKASTILKNFERYLPKVYDCLIKIADAMGQEEEEEVIKEIYPTIPSISIDYGIMERSSQVVMLSGDFGWNDVGSWDSLDSIYERDENGNIICGAQINLDTRDCVSISNGRLIATVGVEGLIIVETADAVLVCDKNSAQSVKDVVDVLKAHGEEGYL